jgi:hypothetical protein
VQCALCCVQLNEILPRLGGTLLHTACMMWGDPTFADKHDDMLQSVQLLFEAGMDADWRDNLGGPPLLYALQVRCAVCLMLYGG